jgi:hypothetical protein
VEQTFHELWQFLADWEHHQGFWVMVGALSGAVSALVIIGAAFVAWSQLHEAQVLRENQTRPFVVIEFHPEASSVINMRISNLGSTMARYVSFAIKPPLETTHEAQWHIMDMNIFRSGIRSLAPGRVIEFFFDTWIGRGNINGRHQVTITYRGEGGRQYTDELDLDLDPFLGMHFIGRKGLHDIHKQLEEIAGTLQNFKAWGGGLLAKSPADVAKEEEEFMQVVEEQRKQSEKAP